LYCIACSTVSLIRGICCGETVYELTFLPVFLSNDYDSEKFVILNNRHILHQRGERLREKCSECVRKLFF
jgi:hypothetical protein